VALRAPNIVEIVVLATGTSTLLHAHCSLIWWRFVAYEIWLEGHHSGNRKKHRGVVRNEAGRLDLGMALVDEKITKSVTHLVG
jgi:hypothetical protein